MEVIGFESLDGMFEFLDEQNKTAKEWADKNNAVAIINRFTYFGTSCEDLAIIGEKVSAVLPREEYETQQEYDYEKEYAEEDIKFGYIFGKWYSIACPEGELGSQHLSQCFLITKEFFEAVKSLIQVKS